MELSFSNIVNTSTESVKFETRCDGSNVCIVFGRTNYKWTIKNGGIMLNLDKWTPESRQSDTYAVTGLLAKTFLGANIFGNY